LAFACKPLPSSPRRPARYAGGVVGAAPRMMAR
jgi:hypothetical protein